MTRVGIIGCGGIARFHCEGYERAGAQVVHACDVRREAARDVAERCGARCSTDYRTLLDDPEVELVSVCTTAGTHREICLAAVDAGKGVVCEKTLTENPADAAKVVRAAAESGAFLATAYMKNFFPAVRKAAELLADMGPITSLYARTFQPSAGVWADPLPTGMLEHPSPPVRKYGGGALVCGGSHVLNLVHRFAGRPERVSARMQSRDGLDFDVQACALLHLPGGGSCHFEAMWHPMAAIGYERNGWDERFEINTPAGRLEIYTVLWHRPESNGVLLVHHDAASGRMTEHRFEPVNVFDVEMAEMLRAFEAGETPSPSGVDGYVVDELIAHVAESAARDGETLDVQWRDRA